MIKGSFFSRILNRMNFDKISMYQKHPLLKALHPEGHGITSLMEENVKESEIRIYDRNLD